MNVLHVLALGAFILGGAHYVRNGADFWYGAWCLVAFVLCWRLNSLQETSRNHDH